MLAAACGSDPDPREATLERALVRAVDEQLQGTYRPGPPDVFMVEARLAGQPIDPALLASELGLPLEDVTRDCDRGEGACVISPPVSAHLVLDSLQWLGQDRVDVTLTYYSHVPPYGDELFGISHQLVLEQTASAWTLMDVVPLWEYR